MSEISSRPRVQSVACNAELPIVAGFAVLCCGALGILISSLSRAGTKAYEAHAASPKRLKIETVKPLSDVSRNFRIKNDEWTRKLTDEHRLDQVEAAKVATLLTLSNAPFVMERSASEMLGNSLKAFCKANDSASAQRLQEEFIQSVEDSHQTVFDKGVSLACAEATSQAGFASVKTVEKPSNMLRVIGTDSAARSLVTEITRDAKRHLIITTEALGLSDGSCGKIMDTFDQALESQGIKTAAPMREHKSGVLDLSLATAFVRSKVTRTGGQEQSYADERAKATQRARKMNLRASLANRRGGKT